MAIKPLFKTFRKAKVSYPWLPPIQLQKCREYAVLSRCTPSMARALLEIREGLVLMGSPAFASMKLLHVPGRAGESDRQVALYARFKGWQEAMKEAGMIKQRDCTELYAQGHGTYEIEKLKKIRNGSARFHIVNGLKEYSVMFLLDDGEARV